MCRHNDVFRGNPMSFRLSSLLHTAYRAPVGHGRFAGTGGSLLFFFSPEATGWVKGMGRGFKRPKGFDLFSLQVAAKTVFVIFLPSGKPVFSSPNKDNPSQN